MWFRIFHLIHFFGVMPAHSGQNSASGGNACHGVGCRRYLLSSARQASGMVPTFRPIQQVWNDSSAACGVEILVWVRPPLSLASMKMAVTSRAMVASVETTRHDVATSVPSSRPRENREVERLMSRGVTMIRVNFSRTLRSAAFLSGKTCLRMFCKKYSRGACSCVFFVAFCFITTVAVAAEPEEKLPPDVRKFFHDANICRYLSGE